jgi:hypothetical protein
LQLRQPIALFLLALPALALADDRVDTTVTWFQERRPGSRSLTVVHPQMDLGFDLGDSVTFTGGYEADIVSGATPAVYAAPRPGTGETIDAVSSASQMSDLRHEGHGALTMRGARASLTVGYGYGTERDYRSHILSVSSNVDLPGKNTNLGLSYTRNFDQVCDFANGDATPLERRPLSGQNDCFTGDAAARTVSRDLEIDSFSATLVQNLTPTAALQLGAFGQVIRGFQGNPYRRVRVFEVQAQESVPLVRDRGALFVRLNVSFPTLNSSASLFARAYSDTWGVTSGTVELAYHQYLGKKILFRLRGRGYQQTGAIFFRDASEYQTIGPVGEYFTGDRELAPLRDVLVGGRLSILATAEEGRPVWGLFDEISVHLNAEGLWSEPLTETPPGGDVPGPLPDSIVAQIGLLLRY